MFVENEVLTFILGVIAVAVVMPFSRRMKLAPVRLFCRAILLLAGAYLFTNVEVLCCPHLFNLLEHMCFAGAGLLFYLSVRSIKEGKLEP